MKIPRFHPSYGRRLNPYRDWVVLLIVILICLIASFVWNRWLFTEVADGVVLGSAPTLLQGKFDQSTLDKLADIFKSRASEATKYKDGTYHFIDPSK